MGTEGALKIARLLWAGLRPPGRGEGDGPRGAPSRPTDTAAPSLQPDRPAFYALAPGRWRDYVTLLHPPYTLWHLSYVVLGAALAPSLHYDRLAATVGAFFLGVGIAAHALDELAGRPLRTQIPDWTLRWLTGLALAGAIALGGLGAALVTPWLGVFIAFGLFIVLAYNLEWFRGRFHTDLWFALAWGGFPLLCAYWVNAEKLAPAVVPGLAAAVLLSLAQRVLSRRVRTVRRKVLAIEGSLIYADGTTERLHREMAIAADEHALLLLSAFTVMLSTSALLARVF
ncbi:MAG TPA: hypothetical protein VJ256_00280 [Dehalococcoidia bacterium]|nr:hypothetical protein [Dehalococcoidia bacterium]